MDSNEKILDMLGEVLTKVSALDERTKNFCDTVANHSADIAVLQERISHSETDIAVLKRDRWWIGTICSCVGGIIAYIIQLIMR